MTAPVAFAEARKRFHTALLKSTLTINGAGVVSNADGSSAISRNIAKGIAERLKAETVGERIAGQTSGNQLEGLCPDFLRDGFLKLGHTAAGSLGRPSGVWAQPSGNRQLRAVRPSYCA
jgi:hypothetical protein